MVEHNSTPSDTSPTRKRARISDSSDTSSHLPHPDSIRISKRVRTNSSKASEKENQIQLPLPDVTFERRRVNPESLALRLGPELVHDLDALVPPGSRDMPSFASRKELQERHKVDRRHIYDYYHSKGLRVVKEDKHGNPIKQTEPIPVIPQSTRRRLRPPAPKAFASPHSPPSGSSDIQSKSSKRQPKPRTIKQHISRSKKPGSPNPTVHTQKYSSEQEQNPEQPPYYQTKTSYHDQPQLARPNSPGFFIQSWLPSTQTLEHYDTNFNVDDFHFYPPLDHPIAAQGLPEDDTYNSASSQAMFDSIFENPDSETDLEYPSLDRQPSQPASAVPESEALMTSKDALGFYDVLDNVLGPAIGIQESVGTYKTHMAEQRQLYFERLLPESQFHMRKVRAQTYVRSQSMAQDSDHISATSVDFRRWIVSDSSADIPLNTRHSSSLQNNLNGTRNQRKHSSTFLYSNVTDPETSRTFLEQADYRDHLPSTLDDLFPSLNEPAYRAEESFGSPIQHSIAGDPLPSQFSDASPILPMLDLDSPLISQTSPDVQSSPFIQTPSSVYQQFIQHKTPQLSSFDRHQWNNTYHSGEYGVLQGSNAISPGPAQELGANGEIFVQNAERLGLGSPDSKFPAFSRARVPSSDFVITRTRTTSAGGGI